MSRQERSPHGISGPLVIANLLRRDFLRAALAASGGALVGCDPGGPPSTPAAYPQNAPFTFSAPGPVFLDLQFSQEKFLELLRDQVQRELPLITDEFPNKLKPGGDPWMVDHLDVSSISIADTPSAIITIAGPNGPFEYKAKKVRVQISVSAQLTTRPEVIAAGHLSVPPFTSVPLWVYVDISAKASAGSLVLMVKPVEVDSPFPLKDEEKNTLLAKMPSLDRTIPLPDIAGFSLTVTNAGLTLKGDVIAIKAELTPPVATSTFQAWKDFYDGNFIARAGDWSILLPAQLMTDIVDYAITDAVNSLPAKDPKIEVVKEPVTAWLPNGPISFATINVRDACPAFDSDIEVDLTFSVSFALASGEIQVTINVSWDLDNWDVFRCAVAFVSIPGMAAIAGGSLVLGPVGAILAAVATIIGFIIALVMISDEAHGQLSDGVSALDPGSMGLHTVEKDSDHAVIQGHVKLGDLISGMTPTTITATPAGLLLAGTLAVPPHHERSIHSVGQSPFDWQAQSQCNPGAGYEQVEAKLGMKDSWYPVQAKIEVLTQPASAYTPNMTIWYTFGFSLSVHQNIPPPVPVAENIPPLRGPDCELLIRTNSGVRYANLGQLPPEPGPPSSEEVIEAKVNCMYPKPRFGPQAIRDRLWNPPPYHKVIEQLHVWDVVASSVTVGAEVELAVVGLRGDSRVVAKVAADASGRVAFRIATGKGQSIAVDADKGLEQASLVVTGAVLEPVARFVPRTSATDATVVGAGAQARVMMATGDHVLLFGLDGRSLGRAAIPAAQHIAAIGNRSAVSIPRKRRSSLPGTVRLAVQLPAQTRVLSSARTWPATQGITRLDARGTQLLVTLRDGSTAVLIRHFSGATVLAPARTSQWLAEPWLQTPLQVGNLAARVERGAVVVYRYVQTAIL